MESRAHGLRHTAHGRRLGGWEVERLGMAYLINESTSQRINPLFLVLCSLRYPLFFRNAEAKER